MIGYLTFLMIESVLYLFITTMTFGLSTLFTIENINSFDDLFRYPFGPVGYYAMGIMCAIFYFEYT